MKYLLIHHQVADFDKWKPGYDGHRSVRIEAGLTDKHLYRSIDDPNDVVLLFEVSDEVKARAFATSPGLKAKMQEVGVLGKPTITLLDDGA